MERGIIRISDQDDDCHFTLGRKSGFERRKKSYASKNDFELKVEESERREEERGERKKERGEKS